MAPVPALGPVRRFVSGQRVRRSGNMQTGRRSRSGRHRRVQSVAPQPSVTVGAHPARGGRSQRLLYSRGVGGHTGGVQVRGGQRVFGRLVQPGPFVRQQHAGAAASPLRRVRGRQSRTSQDTQDPVETAAQG